MSAEPEVSASQLRWEHVRVRLGERAVLDEVSFSLSRGEVVGLLGRNGAGKTTVVRATNRSVGLEAGQILLDERSLSDHGERSLARQIASVPQDMHVPFPFTAGEIVLMGRSPYQGLFGFDSETDLRVASEAMSKLGVAHLANRRIDQLSGGERQLVLIARALTQSPDWLLLDEPTAFLDLQHRIHVLEVVRDFARAGGGALVVSHDLVLAARVCDRLVVLSEGRVLAEGPPSDVMKADVLEQAFGLSVQVVEGPDGRPLVIPRVGD